MKTLLGFDLDGVVLDSDSPATSSWLIEAFAKTLREFGIPEIEENVQALHIVNLRENIQAFCQRFGIGDPAQLLARREENYVNNKLAALEKKYDKQFAVVFEAIRQLMEPPPEDPKPKIGFRVRERRVRYAARKKK